MWDKLEVDLGDVLEKSKHQIRFKHVRPLEIMDMTSSCGCTKPVYNFETGEIDVTYKAGRVPKHLRYKGSFVTVKEIKVFTTDSLYTLKIRATIKMKYYYDR